jgi:serine phosphatase RsbU (regulator of sigma subunit)
MLPAESPTIEGVRDRGLNIPPARVSGDYFDYITVDDERLGVAIADVSGKACLRR